MSRMIVDLNYSYKPVVYQQIGEDKKYAICLNSYAYYTAIDETMYTSCKHI